MGRLFGQLLALLASSIVSWATFASQMTLGIHVHESNQIETAADIGYTAIRLWDTGTSWRDLAPEQDLLRLDRLASAMDASERAHLKPTLVLGSTPQWASLRPDEKCAYGTGCAAEPAQLENWRHYVSTIATAYRGRIECYEPWNEVSFPSDPAFVHSGDGGEPGYFYSGSIASMVTLARIAYLEIKRVDPKACVLSPSFHSSGDWEQKFDRFLTAGGGQYFDVVSWHFYASGEPEQALPLIAMVRRVLAKHALDSVPIWNTEVGASFTEQAKQWPGLSIEDLVYAWMLRTYLVNASEGVSRVYWYAWDDGEMGFRDSVTNLDFGSEAARAAVHLLDGVENVRCHSMESFWQCQLRSGRRTFEVLWLGGKDTKPIPIVLERPAIRWGHVPELLPAGSVIALDGRPIVVDGI